MPQWLLETKHTPDIRNGFLLHLGAGNATVESVVVRIDPHGKHVGESSHRVRRLQHLPDIQRMVIRIIVLHPYGNVLQYRAYLVEVIVS